MIFYNFLGHSMEAISVSLNTDTELQKLHWPKSMSQDFLTKNSLVYVF